MNTYFRVVALIFLTSIILSASSLKLNGVISSELKKSNSTDSSQSYSYDDYKDTHLVPPISAEAPALPTPPQPQPLPVPNPIISRPEDDTEFYKKYCPHCKKREESQCVSSAWNLGVLYRYNNQELKDHIYTMEYARFRAGKDGYLLENSNFQIFRDPETNTVPLFEYWNPKTKKHLYGPERSESYRHGYGHGESEHDEQDGDSGHMYKLKTVVGYIFDRMGQGTVPLNHFLLNDHVQDNVYTVNPFEFNSGNVGYKFQGVIGHVCPVIAN